MDITRNDQTVTFRENEHGDLVQESDYMYRGSDQPMPLKNFLLNEQIVVAATLMMARQAQREWAAAKAVEVDAPPRPCESCGVHDAPSMHQCATVETENVLIEGTEDDPFDMHQSEQARILAAADEAELGDNGDMARILREVAYQGQSEAEIMARVTGSIGATVIHERCDANGNVTETSRETFGNVSTPATHHPGRCYCGRFAPEHAPGLMGRAAEDNSCEGDTSTPHDPATCPACVAAATDFQGR